MKSPTACIVAFDLDFTLTHFRSGLESLFATIAQCGVPATISKPVYRKIIRSAGGFSPSAMAAALIPYHPHLRTANLERALTDWLEKNIALYSDVAAVLAELKVRGLLTRIITAGNEDWQHKKIHCLGLTPDFLHIVSPTAGKGAIIKKIYAATGCLVVYIDDDVNELDRICDTNARSAVISILIVRSTDLHRSVPSRYTHLRIKQLTEVLSIIDAL